MYIIIPIYRAFRFYNDITRIHTKTESNGNFVLKYANWMQGDVDNFTNLK